MPLIAKLEICEAMGWIPKELATVVKRRNNLRCCASSMVRLSVNQDEAELLVRVAGRA